jgi:membrane associated rhomboid family serine protease
MAWEDRAYNRDSGSSFSYRFGFTPPTPMTLGVMIACFAGFLLEAGLGPRVFDWGALDMSHGLAFKQPWRWITYQYLHAGVWHIFFNLLAIYFFLPSLERLWGPRKAFAFYTIGGVVAGITYGIIYIFSPYRGYIVGASGSILAALGACALLFPERQLLILFFPVPIRMFAALAALLFTLWVIGERDTSSACHLGGLVYGVAAPYYGGPWFHKMTRSVKRRRVQRAVQDERQEQAVVDRILQKVHDSGMQSLNRSERKALQRATDRQRKRDRELASTRRQ